MNKKVIYIIIIIAILITGAGYWYYKMNSSNVQTNPLKITPALNQNIPATETPKPVITTESESTTSVATEPETIVTNKENAQLPQIDETWNTYKDKASTFEFKWPTHGRYAPSWEVGFSDRDCADDDNGLMKSKKTFEVDGVTFCHVSISEGAAGSSYLTDIYTTKRDNNFITITFNKKVTSAGALNCDFANEYPYSTSDSSCIPFDQDFYESHLDQIISTFRNIE